MAEEELTASEKVFFPTSRFMYCGTLVIDWQRSTKNCNAIPYLEEKIQPITVDAVVEQGGKAWRRHNDST